MAWPTRALEPASERGGEQLRRRSTASTGVPARLASRSQSTCAASSARLGLPDYRAGPMTTASSSDPGSGSCVPRSIRTMIWLDRAGPEDFREGGNGGRELSNGGQVCALQ
jgi:hypothetical protein